MSKWPHVRLDDVARVVRGVTYTKSDVLQLPTSNAVPILRAGNINEELITERNLIWIPPKFVSKNQMLQLGDIVMCMSSGSALLVGKSAQLKEKWNGSFGAFCAVIRTNRLQADASFIAYVLATPAFRTFAGAALGNNIKNLNKSSLEGYLVPLPSLNEQQQIVGLLDRAAEIRRRASAARSKARAIVPALFLNMFGDPVGNPKGWQSLPFGDAIEQGPQNGLYRPSSDYGDGVRILRIDSFDDGRISNQDKLKRLRVDADTVERFGLCRGDIVINRVNSPPQLGKAVLIPELEEPTVFESNMMRLRLRANILLPEVAGAMLQLPSTRQALTRNAKHAINQSSINQGDVKAIPAFSPPLPLQFSFAEQAQRLEATARALDTAATKAEAMALALSADVFGVGLRQPIPQCTSVSDQGSVAAE